MTVITVSREFGTYGDVLAERVGQALGYHCVDKALIGNVLRQYGFAEFDLEYEKQPGFWDSVDIEKSDRRELMVRTLNQVVQALARHGDVVILGRSGYAILSGLRDVLHVRLHAPLEERIDTVRLERGMAIEAAADLVKLNDKIRRSFIESFYRVPWDGTHAFDLAINAALVPLDTAASWVIEAARLKGLKTGKAPTTKGIKVDEVLMQAVAEKLKCGTEHPG